MVWTDLECVFRVLLTALLATSMARGGPRGRMPLYCEVTVVMAWFALLQGCFLFPGGPNSAPELAPIDDVTLSADDVLTIQLVAVDADDDPLTFRLGQGPDGATVTADLLAWTPSEADQGQAFAFVVEVSDNQDPPLVDAASFVVTVEASTPPPPPPAANRPPVASPVEPQTVAIDETLNFDLSATDPDGDALVWSLKGLPENASLTEAGTFSFTPSQDQVGTYDLVFTVSDDADPPLTDDVEVSLEVTLGAPIDFELTAIYALQQLTVVPENVCADLVDALPLIKGESPLVLGSTRVGTAGAVEFIDVTFRPALGFAVVLSDCDNQDALAMDSVTVLPPYLYEGASSGDVISAGAFAVDRVNLSGLDASAQAAGYQGSLTKGGFVLGFTLVSPSPFVASVGATVGCPACSDPTVYYADTDLVDGGLFVSEASLNTATSILGLFLIPDAEFGVYEAAGDLAFDDLSLGGLPGAAVVVPWEGR